jgi:hypothetical protein
MVTAILVKPECSRLGGPVVRSSEFVHAASLDSIARLAGRRAHSPYIPDH